MIGRADRSVPNPARLGRRGPVDEGLRPDQLTTENDG